MSLMTRDSLRPPPHALDVQVFSQRLHDALVLARTGAVEPGTEHRDDLQHVLGEFFLKARLLAFVNDNDFDTLEFAEREDEFGAEAQQTVLVGQRQAPCLPSQNHLQEPLQALLAIVYAGAQVPDDLGSPTTSTRAPRKENLPPLPLQPAFPATRTPP